MRHREVSVKIKKQVVDAAIVNPLTVLEFDQLLKMLKAFREDGAFKEWVSSGT